MNLLSKASHGIKVSLRSHVRTPDKAEKKKKRARQKKVVLSQNMYRQTVDGVCRWVEGRLAKASHPDAAGRGAQV